MEEYDTLVLNPEWISHGVYKIINWASNYERFSLSYQDFNAILHAKKITGKRYAVPAHGLYLTSVEYPKDIFIANI